MGFLNSLSLPPMSNIGRQPVEKEAPKQSEMQRRRSLVQVVLLEVMRRQGIPSDWISCHTLHVPRRRGGRPRMLVQLVVRKGDDQLVGVIHQFQDAFRREITRYDVAASEWVAALSWEFSGERDPKFAKMPPPETWASA